MPILLAAVCAVAAIGVLTGIGEHRRGGRGPAVLLAILFFPVAWAAWYARDEQPYRRRTSGAV